MKKLLSFFLSFALVLGISACSGGESQTSAAEATVTSYIEALQAGDLNEASTFISKDYIDPLGASNLQEYIDSMLESLNMGDTFDAEARDFVKNAVGAMITDFEIVDASENEEGVTVNLNITGKDYETVDTSSVESELTTYMETYVNDNMDKLMTIMSEQGEDAMMESMMQDVAGYMFDEMEKVFLEAPEQNLTIELDLEQNDSGDWQIVSGTLSENTEA